MGNGALGLTVAPFDLNWGWVILKWAYWLVAGMFGIFGLIMITQVKQMTAAFKRSFHGLITLLVFGYFGLTIAVILLALSVL